MTSAIASSRRKAGECGKLCRREARACSLEFSSWAAATSSSSPFIGFRCVECRGDGCKGKQIPHVCVCVSDIAYVGELFLNRVDSILMYVTSRNTSLADSIMFMKANMKHAKDQDTMKWINSTK